MKQNKHLKLVHVIKFLMKDERHVKDLITDYFGNYTVQHLLEAAAKLRKVAGRLMRLVRHCSSVC